MSKVGFTPISTPGNRSRRRQVADLVGGCHDLVPTVLRACAWSRHLRRMRRLHIFDALAPPPAGKIRRRILRDRDAWLIGSRFAASLSFAGSQFAAEAGLGQCEFCGPADFSRARFKDNAGFDQARFFASARFDDARFEGKAWFRETRFDAEASFDRARFSSAMDFTGVSIPDRPGVVDEIATWTQRLGNRGL
jgi:hypothetical protein